MIPLAPIHVLRPIFSSPRVAAWMSTREGGVGQGPYASFNLRPLVGDDDDAVSENRRRWALTLGVPPVRVEQVHGAEVIRLVREDAMRLGSAAHPLPRADASFTTDTGLACEIQVADCLPVLFAHRGGRAVGAAHAGWRGVAGGVLENAVQALCAAAGCAPDELEAWLGPCIGPDAFEVGADVLQAFAATGLGDASQDSAVPFHPAGVPGKWLANLQGLARSRLAFAGVEALSGNDGSPAWCTVSQASKYFSFRRDRGICGRMAAAICLREV